MSKRFSSVVVSLIALFAVVAPVGMASGSASTTHLSEAFTGANISSMGWTFGGAGFQPCLNGSSNTSQAPIGGCSASASSPGSLELASTVPNSYTFAANSIALPLPPGIDISYQELMAASSGEIRLDFIPPAVSASSFSGFPSNSLASIALDSYGASDVGTSCSASNSVTGEKISIRDVAQSGNPGCLLSDTSLASGTLTGQSWHQVNIEVSPTSDSSPKIVVSIDGTQVVSVDEPSSLEASHSIGLVFSSQASPSGGIEEIKDLSVSSGSDGTVPSAPTGVVTTPGNSQVKVTWSPPISQGSGSITQYVVTSSPGNFQCRTTSTSCTVMGLLNGRTYKFAVVAVSSAGSSVASKPSPATTPGSAPGTPSGVNATLKSNSALVSWHSSHGADYYLVTAQPGKKTCQTASSSCTFAGLTYGVTYSFTVLAVNSIGSSVEAPSSNFVTPIGPPMPPTGVRAVLTGKTVTVTWTSPRDDGAPILSYTARTTSGDFSCSAASNSCEIAGLTPGKTYSVRVEAINRVGPSPFSSLSNSFTVPEEAITSS